MTTLPCHHRSEIVEQINPTIQLLSGLDQLHPDILQLHGIQPIDYHGGLVFRSAIEHIRGSYIASSVTEREAMVRDVLENLDQRNLIHTFKHTAKDQRYDFEIALQVDLFAALEVKGGEGNSINISDRPLWASEFGVWCHLSGAIVNSPASGARSVVNRLTNELVRRGKQVDVLFFKDRLCGTRVRPCPKYPGREERIGLHAAPDVFLLPQRQPVYAPDDPDLHDPSPPVHGIDTLRLPTMILDLFDVPPEQ
jgi:hypothetical protein